MTSVSIQFHLLTACDYVAGHLRELRDHDQVCLLHLQQESRHQMSSLPLCNIPATTVTLKQSGSLSSAWPAVQVRHLQEELRGQGDAEEAQGESDKTFTSLFACSMYQSLQQRARGKFTSAMDAVT